MKRILLTISLITAVFVLSVADVSAQRKSVSAKEVNGTFDSKFGTWKILSVGKGKLKVEFQGIYEYKMANGEMMANTGEARGTAFIKGDTATFQPDDTTECTIKIKFVRSGLIKVSQDGDSGSCGFGLNVSSGGNYKKTSSAKPTFL